MPAKKGNTNALKHGIYARRFQPQDSAEIADMPTNKNEPELAVARLKLNQLLEKMEQPNLAADLYIQYSLAATALMGQIHNMTRANMLYGRGSNPILSTIYDVLRGLNDKQHVR